MNTIHDRLLAILERFASVINSRLILARALRECDLTPTMLSERTVRELLPRLERAADLFVSPNGRANLHRQLAAVQNGHGRAPLVEATPRRVTISVEEDVSAARLLSRQMCHDLGARGFAAQKVATAVSELARNIVSYTKGGTIELTPFGDPPPRILLRATDDGPGIADLELVMSGRYRSKTGLGKGLAGTKRLVDRFDIRTGPGGTQIEAEVLV